MTDKNNDKAVALKYPTWANAPVIMAKAKGDACKKLLEVARENDIPVVQDEKLINVLSIADVGELIPVSTYEAIAAIFTGIQGVECANAK